MYVSFVRQIIVSSFQTRSLRYFISISVSDRLTTSYQLPSAGNSAGHQLTSNAHQPHRSRYSANRLF